MNIFIKKAYLYPLVKHLILIITICSIPGGLLFAQPINGWTLFPSFSSVKSMSSSQNQFVATTGGGIIEYRDGNASTRTIGDGLYNGEATTVYTFSEKNLTFIGYSDGTIDVINNSDYSIIRLNDIRRVERFDSKMINSFKGTGTSLYVATDFGVVEYDLTSFLVNNSYTRFNEFDPALKVTDLLIENDSIYVSTTQGIAVGSMNDELNDIEAWLTYTENSGLNTPIVNKVISFSDSILVLNAQKISAKQNGQWADAFEEITNGIIDITVSPDNEVLALLTDKNIYLYDQNFDSNILEVVDIGGKNSISVLEDLIILGTDFTGLYIIDIGSNETNQILPDGPQVNFLNKLLIDEGNLIGTSTAEFPGFDPLNPLRGYSIFNGSTWENYNRLYQPELSTVETIYSVSQTTDYYFTGSWGDGVIRQAKSDNTIDVFNNTNSNLSGINSNNDFVVISGLDSDTKDNLWAVSYLSEYPLNMLPEGSDDWINYTNVTGTDNYYTLYIDSNDQKWISLITNTNSGLGLLVMDTNEETTQNDDEYIKLTENPVNGNLPHPKVNTIIEDRNGEVWIGTDRGIARFLFPEFIINGSANERQAQWLINEDTTAASRFLLRDLNVTALEVNSANQKWVGSRNQGLWLLNSEGSSILKRFTAENSNLISNNINDIKINEITGEVFISTDLGLVSYKDVPKVAANKMNSLKVYPNPYRYSTHEQILIEGLADETLIKIIGVDGFVVRELETRGGRISWDGRDHKGNKLGTGVYYVISNSMEKDEKGIGKVVIVN